jgi:hypothetical protein
VSSEPFREYRGPHGKIVYARQRSEPFRTTLRRGLVDQRKAGSGHRVDYRVVTKGEAGDYELYDQQDGTRSAMARAIFEAAYTLNESSNSPSDDEKRR